MVMVFDQPGFKDDPGQILKGPTRKKRYDTNPAKTYPIIDVQLESETHSDWDVVTNKSENRSSYKRLLARMLMSDVIKGLIPNDRSLTINGVYPDGKTVVVSKRLGDISVSDGISLKQSEADTKMYDLAQGQTNLLVSLDIDITLIGVIKQALENDGASSKRYFIEYGRVDKKFIDLSTLVQQIAQVYSRVPPSRAAECFVKMFVSLGCDFNPFFKFLSKARLFELNESTNPETVFEGPEDFCRLMVTAYEDKYPGINYTKKNVDPVEDVSRLRLDLHSRKPSEKATIPLASVISLQYKRADVIYSYWTGSLHAMGQNATAHIYRNGWEKSKNGEIKLQLVDNTDALYGFPRNIIKGCGCKIKKCINCSCCKLRNGCSRKTCKCICFNETPSEETGTSTTGTYNVYFLLPTLSFLVAMLLLF